MDKIRSLEKELEFLGLLDNARKIYCELGQERALSYIKSNYHLLSKVYHPDLNPGKEEKAKHLQQRLNQANKLISETSDDDLIGLLKKGLHEEVPPKKKILIVEDEFGIQETLRDVFAMEGYNVRVAVDGEKGYQAFLEFKPDLLLTDVVMPNMSGIELVKKTRQIKSDIKVIYISGFFGLRNLKRDLNDEVLHYGYHCLWKPFKISALLELVDAYLHARSGLHVYV